MTGSARWRRRVVVSLAVALLAPTLALSAPGDLDNNFSGDGKLTDDVGGDENVANGVVTYPDGAVVTAGDASLGGENDVALTRYLPNGTPDDDFGDAGAVTFDLIGFLDAEETAQDVLRQGQKLVVVGSVNAGTGSDAFIARRLANGSADEPFGGEGQEDGQHVLEGDGFNIFNAVARQPDGKFVAAGSTCYPSCDLLVARFNPDGTLDSDSDADPATHFSNDGFTTTDFGIGDDSATDLAISNNGKIVVGGAAVGVTQNGEEFQFGVARYKSNGDPDTNFSGDGRRTTDLGDGDEANAIALVNGMIVLGGRMQTNGKPQRLKWAFVAYTSSGGLDRDFDGDGKRLVDLGGPNDVVYDLVVQPDGKLVAVGETGVSPTSKLGIARLLANGKLDKNFGNQGKRKVAFGGGESSGNAVTLDSSNRIVVAGDDTEGGNPENVAVARLKSGLAP